MNVQQWWRRMHDEFVERVPERVVFGATAVAVVASVVVIAAARLVLLG